MAVLAALALLCYVPAMHAGEAGVGLRPMALAAYRGLRSLQRVTQLSLQIHAGRRAVAGRAGHLDIQVSLPQVGALV